MKKQSILTLVTLVTVLVLASCKKYEPKEVKLASLNDSVNYTLGLANGTGIKSFYMSKDSSDKAIEALFNAIDEAYNSPDGDAMYKLGLQIGGAFKKQESHGLFGDSTLVFKSDLVRQGMVNALANFKEGMDAKKAEEFLNKTMMEIQSKKMSAHPAAPGQNPQGPAPQGPAPKENPQPNAPDKK